MNSYESVDSWGPFSPSFYLHDDQTRLFCGIIHHSWQIQWYLTRIRLNTYHKAQKGRAGGCCRNSDDDVLPNHPAVHKLYPHHNHITCKNGILTTSWHWIRWECTSCCLGPVLSDAAAKMVSFQTYGQREVFCRKCSFVLVPSMESSNHAILMFPDDRNKDPCH